MNTIMENQLNNIQPKYNKTTIAGILLLFIGVITLLKHTAFFLFPNWLFSWPMILIVIGLAIGAKNNFQKSNWIVLTGIGFLFLLPNIIPSLHVVVLWPLIPVAIGIRMLTRHNQNWNGTNWEKRHDATFEHYDKSI
jgi:cadmium resistance protein CadD (predicted permease)